MKALIYITIFLMSGIWFTSCKTSRNIETQKQIDYSGDFLYLRNLIESLRLDVNKQTKITTDKLSDLKIENTTVYLSDPDSTGKQYPVKESTTTASKQEQERIEVDETLSITLQQLSNRLDTISNKVNVLLNQKETVVELSWWDLHKDKVYIGIIGLFLLGRGIAQPQAAAALLEEEPPLSDPFLLKDMDKAVARIQQAIENGETIVIFGDYDVDGVSATAILYECLTNLGAQVRCKLPTREGGGYGLNRETLQKLADKGYKLIVTVDNGISAIEEADLAAELGIELVITDHHLPAQQLPKAVAVVDPKREDDTSPFKDLCGAGVAFKLCAALEGCEDPAELLEPFGELAALGTIADVMPLVGENRTIVKEGLATLQDTLRPGLQALLENAGYADRPVTAETVSYGLAPRLNAAGRMDTAAVALKLLLCENEEQAAGIAARLSEINTSRQQAEQQIAAAALEKLSADPARVLDRVIVVSGEGWHPGVIGIVATRLMEKYGRPSIVISTENGEGRGSGRAPTSFNLHAALCACAPLLLRFGGHSAAAGLTIEEEKIGAFRKAINDWAAKEYPVPKPLPLKLDAVADIAELTVPTVQELSRLAPFGSGNPVPVFLLQNAAVDGIWPLGSEGRHCRIRLRQGGAACFVSLFGTAPDDLPYRMGTAVDAAVEVSIFQGRGGPMVSCHCCAMRPAGLGNAPAEQAARFDAFLSGTALPDDERLACLPTRADTAAVYRMVRTGNVFADDLQPLFATAGPENTGKTLASLTALEQLGLIERRGSRYQPVEVTGKKDLSSAPVLRRLAEGEG